MRQRKGHFIDGLPRPTSGLSRTALTGESEGEAAPAAEVGAKPQRSAEKTRGRAGSPTRTTRHSPSNQHILSASPALP
jgi:hypothetical protein